MTFLLLAILGSALIGAVEFGVAHLGAGVLLGAVNYLAVYARIDLFLFDRAVKPLCDGVVRKW